MPQVTVDSCALRDVAALLSADVARPLELADVLEKWAKDVDNSEALKSLGELGYGDKIRAVRKRILKDLSALKDYSNIINQVAEVYEKRDLAASMMLDSSDEEMAAMLFEGYGAVETYEDFDFTKPHTISFETKYFGFTGRVSLVGSSADASASVDGGGLRSRTGAGIDGPSAEGEIRLGTKDSNVSVSYGTSGPSASADASGHLGDDGVGFKAGAEAKAGEVKLGVSVTHDGRKTKVEASSSASIGGTYEEDIDTDAGKVNLGADAGPVGVRVTSERVD